MERLDRERSAKRSDLHGTDRGVPRWRGICSPGRWPPGKRRLPSIGQEAVIDGVGQIMEADLKNSLGVDRDKFMMQVVTGNVKEAPFQ